MTQRIDRPRVHLRIQRTNIHILKFLRLHLSGSVPCKVFRSHTNKRFRRSKGTVAFNIHSTVLKFYNVFCSIQIFFSHVNHRIGIVIRDRCGRICIVPRLRFQPFHWNTRQVVYHKVTLAPVCLWLNITQFKKSVEFALPDVWNVINSKLQCVSCFENVLIGDLPCEPSQSIQHSSCIWIMHCDATAFFIDLTRVRVTKWKAVKVTSKRLQNLRLVIFGR